MNGNCPKCEKAVLSLKINAVDRRVPFGRGGWKCITFSCPQCGTVLGAQIDPIAIKGDIIRALKG